MFKLFPRIDKGETVTVTRKNHKYVILPEEKARKLNLIEALNGLPKIRINSKDIKNAIESGRK
jgi:hypothetical protein